MFSTGQLLFAIFFIIGFTILTVWSYRKDRAKNIVVRNLGVGQDFESRGVIGDTVRAIRSY